jgi:hypothetical protein
MMKLEGVVACFPWIRSVRDCALTPSPTKDIKRERKLMLHSLSFGLLRIETKSIWLAHQGLTSWRRTIWVATAFSSVS